MYLYVYHDIAKCDNASVSLILWEPGEYSVCFGAKEIFLTVCTDDALRMKIKAFKRICE